MISSILNMKDWEHFFNSDFWLKWSILLFSLGTAVGVAAIIGAGTGIGGSGCGTDCIAQATVIARTGLGIFSAAFVAATFALVTCWSHPRPNQRIASRVLRTIVCIVIGLISFVGLAFMYGF